MWFAASRDGRDVSSTVLHPAARARSIMAWVNWLPMPLPLLASSTITSSIHARLAVGMGNTASVATPTMRPPSSRATNCIMASDASMAATSSMPGGGLDLDSCGTSCFNAPASSSASPSKISTFILRRAPVPAAAGRRIEPTAG